MVYITGDTHRSFGHIKNFCKNNNTSKEDILIILGDAGINYYGDPYDMDIKKYINQLDITLFCVHGNHENRPNNIGSYLEKSWHGGIVFYEKEFPTILFPKDGEIFDICGSKVLVIGGAYSIDKFFRICNNMKWWSDEQPTLEIKQHTELNLKLSNHTVDYILTHTCPLKYQPTEALLCGINQSMVDTTTEQWLDYIEEISQYKKWYAGHYHIDKDFGSIQFLFNNIIIFGGD